jgi:V8-like Glu-specific endopeptidase
MKYILTSVLALSSFAAMATNKIIYGADDRLDVHAVADAGLVELSRSTAAMIPTWKIVYYLDNPASESINRIMSLQNSHGVCAREAFSQQPTIADCSGFLVAPDKLVTAGHCVSEATGCGENVWAFDYKLDTPNSVIPSIPTDSVYSCKKVLKSVLDPITKMDYAVVELDRPVADRRPLNFRRAGKVALDTKLVVIGHPSGLPTKIAGGAQVMESNEVFFRGNLDTYGGNSGSAVFNADTHEVEGILVRGARDYVTGPAGCLVSNVIPVARATEAVTHITNVKEILDL